MNANRLEMIDEAWLDECVLNHRGINPVVIYGAGIQGRCCFLHLRYRGIPVRCFVDSNPMRWNDKCEGVDILSPEQLFADYGGEMIIVTPYGYGEQIEGHLLDIGFYKNRIYLMKFTHIEKHILLPDTDRHYPLDLNYIKEVPRIPKVTVFSIIYNTPEHYLRRAIESVLNQTYSNFQYFIIDNGSTDKTEQILDGYAALDARIKVIRNTPNFMPGVFPADVRENLLAVCRENIKSEYVCVLDSDDYYEAEFLHHTLNLAESNDADWVKIFSLEHFEEAPEKRGRGINISCSRFSVTWGLREHLRFISTGMYCFSWWGNLMNTGIFLKNLKYLFSDDNLTLCTDFGFYIESMKSVRKAVYDRTPLHVFVTRTNTNRYNHSVSGFYIRQTYDYFSKHLKKVYEDAGLNDFSYRVQFMRLCLDPILASSIVESVRKYGMSEMNISTFRDISKDTVAMFVIKNDSFLKAQYEELLSIIGSDVL